MQVIKKNGNLIDLSQEEVKKEFQRIFKESDRKRKSKDIKKMVLLALFFIAPETVCYFASQKINTFIGVVLGVFVFVVLGAMIKEAYKNE